MKTIILFIMSYLNMYANVAIGDVFFTEINSFDVEQSIEQLSDTAKVVLARNYKELQDKKVLDYIKAGMPIKISCGYDGDLQQEFEGYVKPNIDASFPIVVEADQLFYLRQNNIVLSERNITLSSLLQRIAPEYKIECINTELGKVRFNNVSTVQVLEQLKKDFGFYSKIYNGTLHVGFAFDFKPSYTTKHDYIIGENVRDYSKLKFVTDIDYKTQVRLKVHKANGDDLEVVMGMKNINGTMQPVRVTGNNGKVRDEKGSIVTHNAVNISEHRAEEIAKAQLKKILYGGYKGSINGFCFPRTKAGDSLKIINPVAPEREGTYLIEKVKLTYEDSKIDRENFITYKLA